MGKALKYDENILNYVVKRDGGILIGEYTKINTKTIITFNCICGTLYSKTLYRIVENGGLFCKECTTVRKKEKTIITNNKKYNANYAKQNKQIMEQHTLKLLEKYNVINVSQLNDVKNKKKETSRLKYNTDYPLQHISVKEKRENTNLNRYNAKNQFQLESIKEKIKVTNLEKYNVEHPSQNQEIQEKIQKNAKKFKEYLMPSGNIRKIQGYEPFALDILMQQYNEEKIKTDRKDVPRIKYTVNEKDKYYFPDIYIPDENKIIEVKSTWTYKCKTDNINQKKEACISQGYIYEIWCFNHKGEKIDIENCNG
jgi:hypothetical protein